MNVMMEENGVFQLRPLSGSFFLDSVYANVPTLRP